MCKEVREFLDRAGMLEIRVVETQAGRTWMAFSRTYPIALAHIFRHSSTVHYRS